MKVRVNKKLETFEGKPLFDNDKKQWTVRNVLLAAINRPKEQKLTSLKATQLYQLGICIAQKDTVDISSEMITLLKDSIVEIFPPIISGQVALILEGEDK